MFTIITGKNNSGKTRKAAEILHKNYPEEKAVLFCCVSSAYDGKNIERVELGSMKEVPKSIQLIIDTCRSSKYEVLVIDDLAQALTEEPYQLDDLFKTLYSLCIECRMSAIVTAPYADFSTFLPHYEVIAMDKVSSNVL